MQSPQSIKNCYTIKGLYEIVILTPPHNFTILDNFTFYNIDYLMGNTPKPERSFEN